MCGGGHAWQGGMWQGACIGGGMHGGEGGVHGRYYETR